MKIFQYFTIHHWKNTYRSTSWQTGLISRIIYGVSAIFITMGVLTIGYQINIIVKEIFPDDSPIEKLNRWLLYYFVLALFIRCHMQKIPWLVIQPYLQLPIKKSKIIHFFLGKSLLNVFNLIPILLCAPFAFKVIAPHSSTQNAVIWLSAIILITLSNNYIALYLKQQLNNSLIFAIAGIASFGFIVILDFYDFISLSSLSQTFFGSMIRFPMVIAIPIVLTICAYLLNYSYLISNTYVDLPNLKKETADVFSISWLERYGLLGRLISLQIKMIFRNRGPRGYLYSPIFFLICGFLVYAEQDFSHVFAIFFGIVFCGMFLFSFGGLIFDWESDCFDFILSSNISLTTYIYSKYIAVVCLLVVHYLLSLVYMFLNLKVLFIQFSLFIFNVGIILFIAMLFALFNVKHIDKNKGIGGNKEGANIFNQAPSFVAVCVALGVYLVFRKRPVYIYYILSLVGIISLIFINKWLNLIAGIYRKRKYIIAKELRGE